MTKLNIENLIKALSNRDYTITKNVAGSWLIEKDEGDPKSFFIIPEDASPSNVWTCRYYGDFILWLKQSND
jgi:hypothetical protein